MSEYIAHGRYDGLNMKGEPVFLRVDAFNEAGVTEGEVFEL